MNTRCVSLPPLRALAHNAFKSSARRVVALLLTFAAMLAVPDYGARAQDLTTTEVWSATLRPNEWIGESDCTINGHFCSDPEVLTNDDFSFGGTDYRSDTDIAGATSSTYDLVAADLNTHPRTTNEESPAVVDGNTLPTASDNEITGLEDEQVRLRRSDWGFKDEDAGDRLRGLMWVSVPPFEVGKVYYTRRLDVWFVPARNWHGTTQIRFRVSDGKHWSRKAYTMTINVTSVNDAATGRPTISGVRQVGETLTASTAEIADADGLPDSFRYQWLRAGQDGTSNPVVIPGANSSTYTLLPVDLGKRISVRVSYTDRSGNSEQMTSDASGTVRARGATNTPPTASDAELRTNEDTDYIVFG